MNFSGEVLKIEKKKNDFVGVENSINGFKNFLKENSMNEFTIEKYGKYVDTLYVYLKNPDTVIKNETNIELRDKNYNKYKEMYQTYLSESIIDLISYLKENIETFSKSKRDYFINVVCPKNELEKFALFKAVIKDSLDIQKLKNYYLTELNNNENQIDVTDKREMLSIIRSNNKECEYSDEMSLRLIQKFENAIQKNDTKVFVLETHNRIKGLVYFIKNEQNEYEACGLNIAKGFKNYNAGNFLIEQVLSSVAKENTVKAQCNAYLPNSARYIGHVGFIAVDFIEGNNIMPPTLDIISNKSEQEKIYKSLFLDRTFIESYTKENEDKEYENVIFVKRKSLTNMPHAKYINFNFHLTKWFKGSDSYWYAVYEKPQDITEKENQKVTNFDTKPQTEVYA